MATSPLYARIINKFFDKIQPFRVRFKCIWPRFCNPLKEIIDMRARMPPFMGRAIIALDSNIAAFKMTKNLGQNQIRPSRNCEWKPGWLYSPLIHLNPALAGFWRTGCCEVVQSNSPFENKIVSFHGGFESFLSPWLSSFLCLGERKGKRLID